MVDSRNRVIEQDGCFRIEAEGGDLWVTELLHQQRRDVAKRWRIRFETREAARRFIAERLREGHNELYHFSGRSVRVG